MSYMTLLTCSDIWGNTEIKSCSPDVKHCDNALYIPLDKTTPLDAFPHWGLYDEDDRLIEAAALRRETVLIGQSTVLDRTAALCGQDPRQAKEGDYIYGGLLHGHYGHFITTTLPRLWYLLSKPLNKCRVVFHAANASDFELSFVKACFRAMNIPSDALVFFSEPTVIASITIPYPAFQEQDFAFQIFADLCHHIGDYYLQRTNMRVGRAYLTKTGITSGAGKIVGEDKIEAVLRKHGFDIIHPELLGFREQVNIFRSYETIISPAGSALHTSVFSEPGCRIVAFSPVSFVNSNLVLIDGINRNNITYYYDDGGSVITRGEGSFLTSFTISAPDEIALGLVNIVDMKLDDAPGNGNI